MDVAAPRSSVSAITVGSWGSAHSEPEREDHVCTLVFTSLSPQEQSYRCYGDKRDIIQLFSCSDSHHATLRLKSAHELNTLRRCQNREASASQLNKPKGGINVHLMDHCAFMCF